MNESIRQAVKDAIQAKGVSQNEFARSIGAEKSHVSNVLGGKVGFVPEIWLRILEGLGLELTITKKK